MARKRPSPKTKEPPQQPAEAPLIPSPETEPTSPDKETMEVHHHPDVEKKGFKEYLLEGLMIFLAVFMGFIAENIREDYTEHKKAEAFAATMISDLKEDTAQLKDYIAYYNLARMNVDTLMKLLSTSNVKNIPSGKLYLYGLWGGAKHFFTPNDATYAQMKSTGSLQFFESKVAREAAEYDQLCRHMQSFDESDKGIYVEVRKLRSQIFEFQYNTRSNDVWNKASPGNVISDKPIDIAKLDSFIKTNPPLLTYDRSIFNQYVELVRSRYIDRKVKIADTVLAHATALLSAIKKEYDTE
jgi:hypothetical protein